MKTSPVNMVKKFDTLEELDPNCAVVFENADGNKHKLVSILETCSIENKINVKIKCEHGHKPNLDYAFIRVDDNHTNVFIYNSVKNLEFVKDIIPLYDIDRTKQLTFLFENAIKKNYRTLPSDKDLKLLTDVTNNPKLSLYFAFFKYYNKWLGYLSIFGNFIYYFADSNSWEFNKIFTIITIFWSISFITSWIYNKQSFYKNQFGSFQTVYSIIGSQSSSNVNSVNSGLLKNLLFAPVVFLFGIILVGGQLLCFFLEIYFTQVYDGPLGAILIPTVLVSVFVAVLTIVYNKIFVDNFIKFEKPVNEAKSRIEKNFIVKFCTSYVPLFITLFVYLPFSYLFTSDIKSGLNDMGFPVNITDYIVNTKRHQSQFFYFVVTNSFIALALDSIAPIIINRVIDKFLTSKDAKKFSEKVENKLEHHSIKDLEIWNNIKGYQKGAQIGAPSEFDIDANFQKLIIQFGYISMFAMIWPIAPFILFLINIVVFKVDYWKVTIRSHPKSIPGLFDEEFTNKWNNDVTQESTHMEPWDGILKIIVWISSIVGPTLTFMYGYCYLPGIGMSTKFDKRSLWYSYNPIAYDWSTIFIIAVIFEHVAFLTYNILKRKYCTLNKPVTIGGFVPTLQNDRNNNAENIEIIGTTNTEVDDFVSETKKLINREIKKTQKFDDDLNKSKNSVKSSSTITAVETDNSSLSITPMSSPVSPTPRAISPQISTADGKIDLKNVSSVDLRAPIKDISKLGSSTSQVAGATIPKRIPTSKNYDSRSSEDLIDEIAETAEISSTKPIDKITEAQSNTEEPIGQISQETVSELIKTQKTELPTSITLSQPPQLPKQNAQQESLYSSSTKEAQSNYSGIRHREEVNLAKSNNNPNRPKSMILPRSRETKDKKKKKGLFSKIKSKM